MKAWAFNLFIAAVSILLLAIPILAFMRHFGLL